MLVKICGVTTRFCYPCNGCVAFLFAFFFFFTPSNDGVCVCVSMPSLQTAPLPHRDRCSSISFSTATGRVFAYAVQHHCAGVGGVESPTQRASCPAQNRFSHPSSSTTSKPHPIRARICVKVSSQCYDRFVFTSSNPPAQPSANLPPLHTPSSYTNPSETSTREWTWRPLPSCQPKTEVST